MWSTIVSAKKMMSGSFSMVNINITFTWVLFIKNVNHSYCKSLPFWSNYIKLELTFKMYMCICYTSVLIQLLWSWYKRYNNHVCFGLDRNNCLCVGKKHDILVWTILLIQSVIRGGDHTLVCIVLTSYCVLAWKLLMCFGYSFVRLLLIFFIYWNVYGD